MSDSLAYRRDIDGLRAVAVGGVVAYHLAPEWTPGGFMGVDVFFVISGFLITTILWSEAREGPISYWRFYARRARRILPALLALTLAVLLAGLVLIPPEPLADLALSAAAAVAFAANFHFKDQSGYFDPPAEAQPLLHTWSLAVEEQFYLLWPPVIAALALAAVLRQRPERAALFLLAATLIGLALAEILARTAPVSAFYLLPARLWELALGGAIAVGAPWIAARLSPLAREAAGGAGIALLAFALFGLSDDMVFPGLSALPACLGAALVIVSGLRNGEAASIPFEPRATGLLRTAPFVGVGLVSYSLYLWHWPLIAFTTLLEGPPTSLLARLAIAAAALALAILSWRFVEQPLRRPRAAPAPTVGWGLAGVVVMALAALATHFAGGWPGRAPESLRAYAEASVAPQAALDCAAPGLSDACAFGAPKSGDSYDLLLLGDSHGYNLTPAAIALAEERGWSGLRLTKPLCLPLVDYRFRRKGVEGICADYRDAVRRVIAENPDARLVMIVARWTNHTYEEALDGAGPETVEDLDVALLDEATAAPGQADARRVLEKALRGTVGLILEETQAEVALFGQTPDFLKNPKECGQMAVWRGQAPARECATPRALWDARRAFSDGLLAALAASSPRIFAIDPTPILCDDEACPPADADGPLYYDKTHLSARGAEILARGLALPGS